LLEIISGRLLPDHGSVEVGQTVRLGYYDQENRSLPANERVIDYIKSVAERIENSEGTFITAGQMLEKFLFTGAMQYSPIGLLSGGEQRRLFLLRVLMGAPNVLLLDEPTNDLDIQTLITLERYLDDFAGCVIVVSHDRYFLDRTVEHIFRFEPDGRIGQYPGNYSNFIEAHVDGDRVEVVKPILKEKVKTVAKESTNPPGKRKLTFKEEKELAAIEAEIHDGEQRQKEIEVELAGNSSDADLVHKLYEERERLTARLADALNRWTELA